MTMPQWCSPPEHFVLGDDEVHIWRAMLDLPPAQVLALEQTLAANERVRAELFRFQKDRTRFIVARGRLRAILGHYLVRNPDGLHFRYNQYGKPTLAEETGSDTICFNV